MNLQTHLSQILTKAVEALDLRSPELGIVSTKDPAHGDYSSTVAMALAKTAKKPPLNLAEVGCDFYVTSCHKWLLSPKGVGMAYIDEKYQDMLRPVIIGHNMRHKSEKASRFDVPGTRDLTHFAGLAKAIDYQLEIGWEEKIRPYCLGLARYLKEQALEEIDGARLTIPMDPEMSGFITSFSINGMSARSWILFRYVDFLVKAMPIQKLL